MRKRDVAIHEPENHGSFNGVADCAGPDAVKRIENGGGSSLTGRLCDKTVKGGVESGDGLCFGFLGCAHGFCSFLSSVGFGEDLE